MQFYAVHFDSIMFTLHSPLCLVEINASLKHNFFVGIRNTPTPKKDPATSASQAADWVLCYKLDICNHIPCSGSDGNHPTPE